MMFKLCMIIAAAVSLSFAASLETGVEEMNVGTENVRIMAIVEEIYRQLKSDLQVSNNSACSCSKYTCQCCVHLVIEKFKLDTTGCLGLGYLPNEYGLDVKFSLNGKVVFEKKVSAKNPPAVCFGVPYLPKLAGFCIKFYNLNIQGKKLYGCVNLEARLARIVISKISLGCFHIPPSQSDSMIISNPKALELILEPSDIMEMYLDN